MFRTVLTILSCFFFRSILCNSGYEVPGKYYISTDNTTHTQAFINCRQAGMFLASIETAEEQAILDGLLVAHKIYGSENGFWLSGKQGIHATGAPYYWMSTGQEVAYTRWAAGQPDNLNSKEHCMQWTVYKSNSGMKTGWNDLPCDYRIKYICERI